MKKNLNPKSSPSKEKEKQNSSWKQKSTSPSNEKSNSKSNSLSNLKLEDFSKEKKNKQSELKDFDTCSHFKENIVNYESNCKDPIQESSYYCLTYKKSICQDCGNNEHYINLKT